MPSGATPTLEVAVRVLEARFDTQDELLKEAIGEMRSLSTKLNDLVATAPDRYATRREFDHIAARVEGGFLAGWKVAGTLALSLLSFILAGLAALSGLSGGLKLPTH